MLTDADLKAVAEFTRVAGTVYPNLRWEELETDTEKQYLIVYQTKGAGLVSWFVEQLPAVGPAGACWGVIAAHREDHLLATGETPAEALEGATAHLGALIREASDRVAFHVTGQPTESVL